MLACQRQMPVSLLCASSAQLANPLGPCKFGQQKLMSQLQPIRAPEAPGLLLLHVSLIFLEMQGGAAPGKPRKVVMGLAVLPEEGLCGAAAAS